MKVKYHRVHWMTTTGIAVIVLDGTHAFRVSPNANNDIETKKDRLQEHESC